MCDDGESVWSESLTGNHVCAKGLHVLDLGSGSGRDCYVCSALVGEQGSVTGIDMTDAQNEVNMTRSAPYDIGTYASFLSRVPQRLR